MRNQILEQVQEDIDSLSANPTVRHLVTYAKKHSWTLSDNTYYWRYYLEALLSIGIDFKKLKAEQDNPSNQNKIQAKGQFFLAAALNSKYPSGGYAVTDKDGELIVMSGFFNGAANEIHATDEAVREFCRIIGFYLKDNRISKAEVLINVSVDPELLKNQSTDKIEIQFNQIDQEDNPAFGDLNSTRIYRKWQFYRKSLLVGEGVLS